LRVALIGVWVYHFNKTEHIHGPYHILQGWFVSMLGIIFLFIFARMLQMGSSPEPCMADEINPQIPTTYAPVINLKKFNKAFILMILMGAAIVSAQYLYTVQPVHLKSELQSLPLMIGRWEGEDSNNRDEAMHLRGADSELYRDYTDPLSGRTIGLYIGYFESQTQGKELINVTLNDLYMKTSRNVLMADNAGESQTINKAVMTSGGRKLLVLYWYDIDGHILTNRYEAKLITAINGAIRNKTNGAIIMITSEIDGRTDVNELTRSDETFIKALLPLLGNHF